MTLLVALSACAESESTKKPDSPPPSAQCAAYHAELARYEAVLPDVEATLEANEAACTEAEEKAEAASSAFLANNTPEKLAAHRQAARTSRETCEKKRREEPSLRHVVEHAREARKWVRNCEARATQGQHPQD